MIMNGISWPGENGMAGTSSSGATFFSSGCAVDIVGVVCGVDSISSGSLLDRFDVEDLEATEVMLVWPCVPPVMVHKYRKWVAVPQFVEIVKGMNRLGLL